MRGLFTAESRPPCGRVSLSMLRLKLARGLASGGDGLTEAASNSILPLTAVCHAGVDCDGEERDGADWAPAYLDADQTATAETSTAKRTAQCAECPDELRFHGPGTAIDGNLSFSSGR